MDAGICNRDASGYNKGIVSWTLVVNGATVNIYENAIRRFKDQTITNTEDKYLVLGNDSPDQVPFIYGIRYYDSLLSAEQIRRNFKVDQKRFGIVDINNGKTGDTCVN